MTAARNTHFREAPASFGQRRMWFLNQLDIQDPTYNGLIRLRVRGPLRGEILSQCIEQLVRSHEVLRTRLVLRDGAVMQFIEPESRAAEVCMRQVDLTDRSEPERAAAAKRLVDDFGSRPIDLTADLPLRALLIRLAVDQYELLLVTHHAYVDDWSILVLEWDLASWYAHFTEDEPMPEAGAVRYADYCIEQHKNSGGAEWRRQLDYWRDELDAAPSRIDFPNAGGDLTTEQARWNEGRQSLFVVPASLMKELDALAQKCGFSLTSAALAAFGVLLWQATGSTDLPIGVPVTDRTISEHSGSVGFFGNTIVGRFRPDPQLSFIDFLGHVHDVMARAQDNQSVPFDAVVEELRPARRRGGVPLFNTMFAMRLDRRTMRAGNVSFVPHCDGDTGTAKVDLMLLLEQRDGEYHALLEYRTAVLDDDAARHIADEYRRLMAAVVAEPGSPLGELLARAPVQDTAARAAGGEGGPGAPAHQGEPETDLEQTLCTIWGEFLSLPTVGTYDDFLDLGGHSLLAAHVAMRVREEFAVTVPLSWMFETPTVRELATDIQQRMSRSHHASGGVVHA